MGHARRFVSFGGVAGVDLFVGFGRLYDGFRHGWVGRRCEYHRLEQQDSLVRPATLQACGERLVRLDGMGDHRTQAHLQAARAPGSAGPDEPDTNQPDREVAPNAVPECASDRVADGGDRDSLVPELRLIAVAASVTPAPRLPHANIKMAEMVGISPSQRPV